MELKSSRAFVADVSVIVYYCHSDRAVVVSWTSPLEAGSVVFTFVLPVPGTELVPGKCFRYDRVVAQPENSFLLISSVWHDHYHRPVHRVCDDRDVRRPF